MASAAEHSHCNTDLSNVQVLPEGVKMIEHVEIGDRWEVGDPTPVPPDAKIRASKGEKLSSLFHTVVHVDDHDFIRAQQSDEEKISFSRVGLARIGLRTTFWAGKAGRDTHPSTKKRSNWNTTLEFLGFVNNSHTLQISVTKKKKHKRYRWYW